MLIESFLCQKSENNRLARYVINISQFQVISGHVWKENSDL